MADEKLNLIVQAVDSATATLNKVAGSVEQLTGGLLKTGAASVAMGNIISNIATKAFNGFVGAVSDGIAAAMDAEAQEVKLASALRTSGQAVESNVSRLKALAGQLQSTTTFEDDALVSAAAYGTQLGLTTAQIEKLLPAVADMSAGLGIDLNNAMRLVAKSEDGSDMALKKYGITLKESKTEAERLDNVVAALNERFKGQASALAGTTQGSVERLGVAWGNLKESVGGWLLTSFPVKGILDGLTSAMTNLSGSTAEASDDLKTFAEDTSTAETASNGLAVELFALKTQSDETYNSPLFQKVPAFTATIEELAKSYNLVKVEADATRQGIQSLSTGQTKASTKQTTESQKTIEQLEDEAKALEKEVDAYGKASDKKVKAYEDEVALHDKYIDAMGLKEDEFIVSAALRGRQHFEIWKTTGEAITQEQIDEINRVRGLVETEAVSNEMFLAGVTASFSSFAQATFQGFADTIGNTWAIAIQGGAGAAEAIKQQWNNFGASILAMLARIIARLLIYRILLGALGPTGTIFGLGAKALMGFSGQTSEGEFRQVPGPAMMPLPILAHGQEIIGRPGGGLGGGAVIVQGDVYGWDESVERLRDGLFNHSKNTGLPVQA